MVFTDSEKFALHAINIMLQTIGVQPLRDEVDLENSIEGEQAAITLEEVKKATLSEEWDFNRDENYSMKPDSTGNIVVPFNVLDIYGSTDSSVIARDWRLYSKTEQTHEFEDAVNCNVVWDMEFNSLTHPIRHYITIRAARIFSARVVGDEESFKFTQIDEDKAYSAALRSDGKSASYNHFTRNTNRANR